MTAAAYEALNSPAVRRKMEQAGQDNAMALI